MHEFIGFNLDLLRQYGFECTNQSLLELTLLLKTNVKQKIGVKKEITENYRKIE